MPGSALFLCPAPPLSQYYPPLYIQETENTVLSWPAGPLGICHLPISAIAFETTLPHTFFVPPAGNYFSATRHLPWLCCLGHPFFSIFHVWLLPILQFSAWMSFHLMWWKSVYAEYISHPVMGDDNTFFISFKALRTISAYLFIVLPSFPQQNGSPMRAPPSLSCLLLTPSVQYSAWQVLYEYVSRINELLFHSIKPQLKSHLHSK